jgi:uncharacterized membrane protein YoaK (UPF0700 family)
MDSMTTLFTFLAALSVATERITEIIKGLPLLSTWLSKEKSGSAEDARKATIHIIAIVVGAILTGLAASQAPEGLHLKDAGPVVYLLYGAMASGGSGLWNSALDILRETNKQKQVLTEKLQGK